MVEKCRQAPNNTFILATGNHTFQFKHFQCMLHLLMSTYSTVTQSRNEHNLCVLPKLVSAAILDQSEAVKHVIL